MKRFLPMLLLLMFINPAIGQAQVPTAQDPVVYIAGDSIVESGYLPTDYKYATWVSNRLCGIHCGEHGYASVRNTAIGGQRLTGPNGLQANWDNLLNADPKPTTIILSIGINDMALVSDAVFINAYLDVVNRATAQGIKVIPSTMMPINIEHLSQYNGAANAIYNQRYWINIWLVSTFGATGINRFDLALLKPNSDPLTLDCIYEWNQWAPICTGGDGLHPNFMGAVALGVTTRVDLII